MLIFKIHYLFKLSKQYDMIKNMSLKDINEENEKALNPLYYSKYAFAHYIPLIAFSIAIVLVNLKGTNMSAMLIILSILAISSIITPIVNNSIEDKMENIINEMERIARRE